ncbi:MAG: hypothetical protein M1434_11630 [Chloroflexi bacterium]|nr:hypothetical protein [Chloroflexota bacterium]
MNTKRQLTAILSCVVMLGVTITPALADKPVQTNADGVATAWANTGCASIADGAITDSAGNPISMGYDKWGYNYQAHMFNGYAGNYLRPAIPVTSGDKLNMKWSDAWLANVDCNGDGKLDRGLVDGVVSGTSKGWLTNQYNGSYIDGNGNAQKYTDFYKIVWVGPGGDLWGQYHVIQEVYNDTGSGNYRFKDGAPGFGLNDQWTTIP